MAQHWVAQGCHTHIFTYLADDTHLEHALFQLGFGLLVIDAVHPVTPLEVGRLPSGITFRPMTTNDFSTLRSLEGRLRRELRSSPTFLHSSDCLADVSWTDFLTDGVTTFVAARHGYIVGAIRGKLGECNESLAEDSTTLAIDFAYTDPPLRGRGIGRALLAKVLRWGAGHDEVYRRLRIPEPRGSPLLAKVLLTVLPQRHA